MKRRQRTVTKTYDSSNVTPNAARLYAGKKIKKRKMVTVQTPRKTKIKVVDYGPKGTYGRQKKTVTRSVIRRKKR